MSTTAFLPTPPPTRRAPRRGAVQLGLFGENGARLADLSQASHTIGGGPRCTVRLDAAGLRPLHCVITPSENGPVIRRWAAETRLNGSDFTEAALSDGDLLRVGTIDLRVVALGAEPQDSETLAPTSPAAKPDHDTETSPITPAVPAADGGAEPEAVATAGEADAWFDDSVEQLAARAREKDTEDAELDPAIPRRLLRPWAPATPVAVDAPVAEPATELVATDSAADNFASEADTAPVELAIEIRRDAPEATVAESVFDLPPAVAAPQASAEATSDAMSAMPDDPWRVDLGVQATDEELTAPFDPAAALTFGEVASPVEVTSDLAARLRERLATRRARAARLVASLRRERRQSAELTAAISDLSDRLELAHAAADEAGAELARVANRLSSSESDRAAALVAVEQATQRASDLEARVAELEAALATVAEAPAPRESVDWGLPAAALSHEASEAADAAVVAEDPDDAAESASPWTIGDATPDDVEQVDRAAWETPAAADLSEDSTPASNSPWASVLAKSAEDAGPNGEDPFAWRSTAEPRSEAAEEPQWGIERLAASQEPTVTASLWDEAPVASPVELVEETSDAHAYEFENSPPAVIDELVDEVGIAHVVGLDADERAEPQQEEALTEDAVEAASGNNGEAEASYVVELEAPADADEEEAPATEPTPPVSFIERYAHLVPEDDEPVVAPSTPTVAPAVEAASEGDESIDDYMRKLMQRVRGASQTAPAPAPTRVPEDDGAASPSEPKLESVLPDAPEPEVTKQELLRDLSEMRRGPAPEVQTDMGALRQLANQSARHAIDVAQTRQSREKATMRLTVSIVSVAVGTLASIVAKSPLDLQFIGGFSSVLIGGWFFVRTVRQCQTRSLDEQIAAATKGGRR